MRIGKHLKVRLRCWQTPSTHLDLRTWDCYGIKSNSYSARMHEFIIAAKSIHHRADIVAGPGLARQGSILTNVGIASAVFFAEPMDPPEQPFPKHSFPWPLRFSDRGCVFRRRLRFPIPNR